jgi:hypothetical protein
MQSNTTESTVGIKDLAAKLGTEPRDLRRFVRGLDLGVGRGTRYAWASLSAPEPKRITAEWKKAHAEAKEA